MKFDFDSAGDPKMKMGQLEEGIKRADANVKIFSDEVQKQMVLKAQLEAELAQLLAKNPELKRPD